MLHVEDDQAPVPAVCGSQPPNMSSAPSTTVHALDPEYFTLGRDGRERPVCTVVHEPSE